MKVRCVRILEGGRAGGRTSEVGDPAIHEGGEYVVISIIGGQGAGVRYALLHDRRPETMVWTSEMFEVVSSAVSSRWRAVDHYGTGKLITLEPDAWVIDRFWERKEAGDREAYAAYVRGITQMYEDEHEPVPIEIVELLGRLHRARRPHYRRDIE